jgi:type 1 glutamine amidotransferase
MKKYFLLLLLGGLLVSTATAQTAHHTPQPKVLVFFALNVEADHALFAIDALHFLTELADKDGFRLEATTNWQELNEANLKQYKLVIWLDGAPGGAAQREAFQEYMSGGGAWLGFHVSAYNDSDTHWPWFLGFIGGGVFDANSWPPVPAKLVVDDTNNPVTKNLPKSFMAPTNEWYRWAPSPRLDKNIHVLLTLDPSNFPLGIKDPVMSGDIPVVWTNINYKMLYMNMGHGDKIFLSQTQNTLIENSVTWLLRK